MDTTGNTRWIRLVTSDGYDSIYVVTALQTYRPYALPEADANLEVGHG